MKVIDLLNKIANGEEVPQKIRYDKSIFKYDEEKLDYFSDGYSSLFQLCCCLFLNDEVEILEEDKKIPKKIEEAEIEVSMAIGEQICANKINEIIDYLESKGE